MKRNGFTLSEILVTLGIVGIISSLLLPAINRALPDKTKFRYLKIYDSTSEMIIGYASNSAIYPVCDKISDRVNISCKSHPLFSLENTRKLKNGKEVPSGNGKLCKLIAKDLNVADGDNKCSDNYYETYSNSTFEENISFIDYRNIAWLITTYKTHLANIGEYETDIYFDLNGLGEDNGPNCLYNKDSCKNPDRFKVMVAADGKVIPADPVGEEYLKTRKNLIRKNLGIEDNRIVLASLENTDKNFILESCNGEQISVNPSNDTLLDEYYKCGDEVLGKIINCYYVASPPEREPFLINKNGIEFIQKTADFYVTRIIDGKYHYYWPYFKFNPASDFIFWATLDSSFRVCRWCGNDGAGVQLGSSTYYANKTYEDYYNSTLDSKYHAFLDLYEFNTLNKYVNRFYYLRGINALYDEYIMTSDYKDSLEKYNSLIPDSCDYSIEHVIEKGIAPHPFNQTNSHYGIFSLVEYLYDDKYIYTDSNYHEGEKSLLKIGSIKELNPANHTSNYTKEKWFPDWIVQN